MDSAAWDSPRDARIEIRTIKVRRARNAVMGERRKVLPFRAVVPQILGEVWEFEPPHLKHSIARARAYAPAPFAHDFTAAHPPARPHWPATSHPWIWRVVAGGGVSECDAGGGAR